MHRPDRRDPEPDERLIARGLVLSEIAASCGRWLGEQALYRRIWQRFPSVGVVLVDEQVGFLIDHRVIAVATSSEGERRYRLTGRRAPDDLTPARRRRRGPHRLPRPLLHGRRAA